LGTDSNLHEKPGKAIEIIREFGLNQAKLDQEEMIHYNEHKSHLNERLSYLSEKLIWI